MASPPFAQLKGTYAANKSFHLALTLLIVWCAIIAGRSAKTRRGGVNGALGFYYSPSERIHLLRCVPGPEIWLELCSLHFQLPLTCVCCWLTDSTRHWKRQMTCWDRALHTNSAYPFLPQEHTHVLVIPRILRPILITIICWYPSTQTTASKFNWFSISRPVDREMRSLSSYSCLNDCLPGVGQSAFRKCRRGVLHLNEPVVVLPLSRPHQGIADAALYSVVLCCPVEWQDENLEIMLFGFAENLHWRELSWYS